MILRRFFSISFMDMISTFRGIRKKCMHELRVGKNRSILIKAITF